MLAEEGTTIVKILLHISRSEQGERRPCGLDDPAKQWKFRPEDLEDRQRFGEIEAAYEEALTKTSTTWAPWYVVPADTAGCRNAAPDRNSLRSRLRAPGPAVYQTVWRPHRVVTG